MRALCFRILPSTRVPSLQRQSLHPLSTSKRISTLRLAIHSRLAVAANCSDMEEGGLDSEGKAYVSRKQMWEEEAGEDSAGNPKDAAKKQDWYHKGVSYWEVSQPIFYSSLLKVTSNLFFVLRSTWTDAAA